MTERNCDANDAAFVTADRVKVTVMAVGGVGEEATMMIFQMASVDTNTVMNLQCDSAEKADEIIRCLEQCREHIWGPAPRGR